MNPDTNDRQWLLAAECVANLTEVAHWDWSRGTQEAADLIRLLADGMYEGKDLAELSDLIDRLSDSVDFFPDGPRAWLLSLGFPGQDEAEIAPADLERWRATAKQTFFELRAELYPDGREQAA